MKRKIRDFWRNHKNKILVGTVFVGGVIFKCVLEKKHKSSEFSITIDPIYSDSLDKALGNFDALSKFSKHPVLFMDSEFYTDPKYGVYDETPLLTYKPKKR